MRARFALPGLAAVLCVMAIVWSGCSDNQSLPTGADLDATDVNLDADADGVLHGGQHAWGTFVIANRGSGTISAVSARDGAVMGTYDLPSAANPPEPMYVVYVKRTKAVVVGDRANNRVVEFDAGDFSVRREAPTGAGVFHMWVDPVRNSQLWVNNDIDNTATVIDPISFGVIATVDMPADIIAEGGKPHDVILGPLGGLAYVTFVGLSGANDYVVQFDTHSFTERGRAAVAKDPHLSLTQRNRYLYVPSQNGDIVQVFDRFTMAPVTTIDVPGAHGAGMTKNGRFFYATNLPGGGTDAIWTIGTRTNSVVGEPVDTPYPVPHNIALTTNGQRMCVTHSGGASDKVTLYRISNAHPNPVYLGEATVGLNPFGLAFAP